MFKKIILAIGAILLLPAFIALVAIYNGWALSILWGWFFVPLGAPAISIPLAIGVSLVVGFFTHDFHKHEKDEDGMGVAIFKVGVIPLIFLAIGSVVKMFI